MRTITTSDFRKNQRQYLELAERERLIIHRNNGKSFMLVPVNEIDYHYNIDFVAKILKAEKEAAEGKGTIIKDTSDIWENIL